MVKNILLVDDHSMFRWGVRQFVASLSDFELAGEAGDGRAALEFVAKTRVDIVLLDIDMPGLDGPGFLLELGKHHAVKPKVVILSQSSSDALCRKLHDGGIDGYILKTEGIGEIANALAALGQGETYFSPGIARRLWTLLRDGPTQSDEPSVTTVVSDREQAVARLVSQGLSNKDIAKQLGCAASTIKTHRANLMRKIGAKNSADVARWAMATFAEKPY